MPGRVRRRLSMQIVNARIYGTDHVFHEGMLTIENGFFKEIRYLSGPASSGAQSGIQKGQEVVDAAGCYVLPGLIDIHFHGCMGKDFCDGTMDAFRTLAKYEAMQGVTAICPATLTLPAETLCHVLSGAKAFSKETPAPGEAPRADLIGVNMEGPFISREKKGAQNEAYIRACDSELCLDFVKASGGLVKLIGLAPEANPGFEKYIAAVKDLVHVSLAHTNSDYETARRAFRAGACHAVHLYNAMPEMTHRNPGVVGAVFDSPHVMAELICDGNHVHPAVVRSTFAMLGAERIVLISDSLRATGLGDGLIDLGGQAVQVEGTRATLVDGGNLAGSVTCLTDCLRIAVKEMGVPLCDAVRCASENPARAIGKDRLYGTIEAGKKGNLLLLKEDLSTAAVFKDGVCILNRL